MQGEWKRYADVDGDGICYRTLPGANHPAGATTVNRELVAIDVSGDDGSIVRLRKIGQEYDPTDRMAAITLLEEERAGQVFTTGLLYVNEERRTLVERARLVAIPLTHLPNEKLRPSRGSLDEINAAYM